ncbi:MAG: hypothetical protein AB7L65_02550 [Hyphomonadaceae bacterium]
MVLEMLQYNEIAQQAEAGGKAHTHARRAHIAHACVVGMHSLCCGAPIALMLFSAGAAAGALGGFVTRTHAFLHGHEFWLIGVSAALILLGGAAEWRARRAGAQRFPVMFALSVGCLFLNIGIIAAHRLG